MVKNFIAVRFVFVFGLMVRKYSTNLRNFKGEKFCKRHKMFCEWYKIEMESFFYLLRITKVP